MLTSVWWVLSRAIPVAVAVLLVDAVHGSHEPSVVALVIGVPTVVVGVLLISGLESLIRARRARQ